MIVFSIQLLFVRRKIFWEQRVSSDQNIWFYCYYYYYWIRVGISQTLFFVSTSFNFRFKILIGIIYYEQQANRSKIHITHTCMMIITIIVWNWNKRSFSQCDGTHAITMSDYVKYPTSIVKIYDGDRIAKNDINTLLLGREGVTVKPLNFGRFRLC